MAPEEEEGALLSSSTRGRRRGISSASPFLQFPALATVSASAAASAQIALLLRLLQLPLRNMPLTEEYARSLEGLNSRKTGSGKKGRERERLKSNG